MLRVFNLFDFDEMTAICYVTNDGFTEHTISGAPDSGIKLYIDDELYGTFTKKEGNRVTLVDYSNFEWDYEEISMLEAEAEVPLE